MEKKFLDTMEIKDFTKKCLNNESIYDYKGSIEIIKYYWSKASNIDDFKKLVFADKRLEDNQGYWELIKEDASLYEKRLREYLKEKADDYFTTESDMGSLSIGNFDFRYNIGNKYGDGINQVYIINKDIHLNCLDFLTTVEGTFKIFDYDCGNWVARQLSGKYAIYREKQTFVFVKWSD